MSPAEPHSRRHTTEDLIFPMSLPQSVSGARQVEDPYRVNSRHSGRPSPEESQRSVSNSRPSSGTPYPSNGRFSYGSASCTQDDITGAESEVFAQLQPNRRRPMIPQQQPQPPPHVNPQIGRALNATDFSCRYPCQFDLKKQ